MAFQIDPNIPLQAQRTTFDPASILMQAQTNAANLEKHRFEMQKLREDYDLAKEKRKQEKAMQMGIASDLAGIQSGTPAQYAPTRFEQTPQRGQMPQGMTGVLRSEQGQQMPQPQAFGEEILNGDFRVGGGEVTQEAVAGREPLPIDFLKSALKQSMLNRDYDNALKFQKAIQESEKTTNEYYGGLTEGIDPKTGQPVLLAMTKTGAVPSGYAPKPKEAQAPKARVTWNVGKGRTEETWGYDAKGNEVLLGVKSLDAPQAPVVAKADPVAQALAIVEGKDEIKRKSEQRAKVAEKYADSEAIEPILKQLITQLGKIPKTGFTRDIQSMVEYFGAGDEEAQNAIAEVVNTSALLVPFAQKQSGPQSDKDVQQYKEQVAAASNPLASASSRMAAAKNALMFAQRVKSKFGSYASDILSGKVTPEELQEKPTQPPKPTLDEKFQAMKEYKANRVKYAKDPTALKILDDKARELGLIK